MFAFRRRLTCPECGAPLLREATLCPTCGHDLSIRRETGLCPACGARIADAEERCPICGASRQSKDHPSHVNVPTVIFGVMALMAFLAAIWLTGIWKDLAAPERLVEALALTDTPSPTPTYTITLTPTRTPTATNSPTPLPSATPVPPTSTPTITEPVVHIVAKNDNLGAIARRYGVQAEDIAKANNISVNAILTIGQKLVIPGTTAPTPTQQVSSGVPPFLSTVPPPSPTHWLVTSTPLAELSYPKPLLLSPTNGSIIAGAKTRIVLNWSSVGILADSEWYLLRIWRSEEDPDPLEIRTKATSWRLPLELYPSGEASCNFLWQVTVVRQVPESEASITISPSSNTYEFCWQ